MPEAAERGRPEFQPKKILVPIDFSELSQKALVYAGACGERFGATVDLVHIAEPVPIFAGIDAVPIPVTDRKQLAILEHRLAELAKELPPNSAGRTIVRSGWALDEIISVAEELKTELIIVSSHGRSGLQRVLLGSTAEGIVRKAPCDVLVLRPDEREFVNVAGEKQFAFALKTIVVPIDFSDVSRKALGDAADLAKRFEAKLICLHVLEIIPFTEPDPALVTELEVIRKSVTAATERTLQEFLKEATSNIQRENILTFGAASREIMQLAEDRKADLIVMGTHGKAGPGRFLLGSTTERVVRHAHEPTLVVRGQSR